MATTTPPPVTPAPTPPLLDVAAKPNPLTIVGDYSKIIIPLASAGLAVLFTFFLSFTTDRQYWPDTVATILIIVSALAFLVAIFSGLAMPGKLTRFLRNQHPDEQGIYRFCNVAYRSLMLAIGCFAVAAALRAIFPGSVVSPEEALAKLASFPYPVSCKAQSHPEVLSLVWDQKAKQWNATVIVTCLGDPTSPTFHFLAALDTRVGNLVRLERTP